jgi:hypothetical protein
MEVITREGMFLYCVDKESDLCVLGSARLSLAASMFGAFFRQWCAGSGSYDVRSEEGDPESAIAGISSQGLFEAGTFTVCWTPSRSGTSERDPLGIYTSASSVEMLYLSTAKYIPHFNDDVLGQISDSKTRPATRPRYSQQLFIDKRRCRTWKWQ